VNIRYSFLALACVCLVLSGRGGVADDHRHIGSGLIERGAVYYLTSAGVVPYAQTMDGKVVEGDTLAVPGGVASVCVCSARSTLYALTCHSVRPRGEVFERHWATIVAYHIGREGKRLSKLNRGSIEGEVDGVVADPKGRFLFAFADHNRVLAYRLRPSGRLGPCHINYLDCGTLSEEVLEDGTTVVAGFIDDGWMMIEPSGRFALVMRDTGGVDHSEEMTYQFRITGSGALTDEAAISRDTNEGSHWSLPLNSGSMKMLRQAKAAGARRFSWESKITVGPNWRLGDRYWP